MRGRAEAVEADVLAVLHAGHTKRSESNDASAQEGRSVEVVELVTQRICKISASDDCVGVAAIHVQDGPSDEPSGRRTKIKRRLRDIGVMVLFGAVFIALAARMTKKRVA